MVKKDRLGNLRVDGMLILKLPLKNWDGKSVE
jgi:hypothetical protein